MGTGWRRAFCTTIPRDSDSKISNKQQRSPSPSPSPRNCSRLGFFSSSSNPSTPRLQSHQPVSSPSLRCRTNSETIHTSTNTSIVNDSPRLECKTSTPKSSKSPRTNLLAGSNPTSPRSPLKLSLFKNSFKFRSSCGICLNSVKTGQGTAIYTAECSHAFHFPCIAAHVRKHGSLVCPVCNTTWKDVPLLAAHKNLNSDCLSQNEMSQNNTPKPKTMEIKEIKEVKRIDSSPRASSKPKVSDSRSYNDDEPLLSPTTGRRIIPIPEADEDCDEAENDVEEFQGFFVNPNTSSSTIKYSDDPKINGRDLRNNVQVRLLPEVALISVNRTHETYAVALRVKAPRPLAHNSIGAPLLESSHRAPIDLVTVLDVSGSMTGAKLYMLKRAMRLVISSLGSADRLSIVAFSASPKRLLPLRRMTAIGQCAARQIIDRLICGQGTSVGEALSKATKVLEDRRERNPVASIMLLSDGQDDRVRTNKKNQRQGPCHVSSTRFAHIEIPVHSFGFGENSGYSNSHEPAEDAFAKCVGGLLSVVVQDLRIQLGFPSGPAQAEISAIYSCGGRPTILGSGSVRVGDLYAEEERELLVELRLPISAAGTHHLISVRCLYKDPSTQEVVYDKEQAVLVPPPSVVRSSQAKIERMRNLFISTRAIAESRRLVEHGDVTRAHHLLASARALLMQSSTAEEYVRSLEVELSELQWRRQNQVEQQQEVGLIQRRRGSEREMIGIMDENGEPLTPKSAWRAAEKLAKVAMMKKSLNRVSDLHGFENARF